MPSTVNNKIKKRSIKTPLSVGEKLYSARKKLKLDLLEIERKTLIRAKYLEALEQSKFYQLPLPVYTYGFVQTYANFVGLNGKRLVQQFQTEFGAAQGASVHQLEVATDLHKTRVLVTPRLLWRGGAVATLVMLFAYIAIQIGNFAGIRPLTLDSPSQDSQINTDSVTVAGQTDPGTSVHIGPQLIPVTEDGHFTESVHVNQGVNTIQVIAENRLGKTRAASRIVQVNAPSTALLDKESGNGQN